MDQVKVVKVACSSAYFKKK